MFRADELNLICGCALLPDSLCYQCQGEDCLNLEIAVKINGGDDAAVRVLKFLLCGSIKQMGT
jgi:hypothetical protein